MPTYRYRCTGCGHLVEAFQSVEEMRRRRDSMRCVRCESKMQWLFPCPNLSTETSFMANRSDLGFGLDEKTRRQRVAKAKREGIDIGGKFWAPELNAWVGSKAEVKALAAAKGRGVNGLVHAPAPDLPPPEKRRYEVAEDIVQDRVAEVVEAHGGDVTPKEVAQITEGVREKARGKQFD